MPRQDSEIDGTVGVALIAGLFGLVALSGAVFTRRRFGFRVVMPLKVPLIILVLMIIYDVHAESKGAADLFAGTSWTLRFCEILVPLGLWHLVEAWLAYRRKEPRLTEFWGEPWLMALGIPYRFASILDCFLIFGAGYYIRYEDGVLGQWLMLSGFCLFCMMVWSWKSQAEDAEALHNTRIYTAYLHERDQRRGRRRGSRPPSGDDEVSTGPRDRR